MGFFKKQPLPQNDKAREDEARLKRGLLPVSTETRLTGLHDKSGFFTSNLSVNEFILCGDAGIRPLGQIMGSTVYQMGWQSPPLHSAELTYMTQAYLQARRLVFGRLQQEAKLLGAHGVVGVRLEQSDLQSGPGLLEWKAFGTAVAGQGLREGEMPFLSALSGQELWALRQAGYQPVGLASGVCGYYQKGDCRYRRATTRRPDPAYPVQSQAYSTMVNREDAGLTSGIYRARSQAMRRLEREAAQAGAGGVVGIHWEMKTKFWETEDFNETFRQDVYLSVGVLGTAIARLGGQQPTVDYCLPLTG